MLLKHFIRDSIILWGGSLAIGYHIYARSTPNLPRFTSADEGMDRILMVIASILMVFYWIFIMKMRSREKQAMVLASGISGIAKIISLKDTNMHVTAGSVIEITLEISPENSQVPYKVKIDDVPSVLEFRSMIIGAEFRVKISPKNPVYIVFESEEMKGLSSGYFRKTT